VGSLFMSDFVRHTVGFIACRFATDTRSTSPSVHLGNDAEVAAGAPRMADGGGSRLAFRASGQNVTRPGRVGTGSRRAGTRLNHRH
jgi:hypothetical protein